MGNFSVSIGSAASPGDMRKLRFQSTDGRSDKFIDMRYNGGSTFTATWGKAGTPGRETEYPVGDWDSYYRKKVGKGYTDVTHGGSVRQVAIPPLAPKAGAGAAAPSPGRKAPAAVASPRRTAARKPAVAPAPRDVFTPKFYRPGDEKDVQIGLFDSARRR